VPINRHGFDVDALRSYLASQLPGFAGSLTVTSFKGGQSNPTFRLDTPERRYVMRSKPGPAARLMPSAHAIEREFRVIGALGRCAVFAALVRCHALADVAVPHVPGLLVQDVQRHGAAASASAETVVDEKKRRAPRHRTRPARVRRARGVREGCVGVRGAGRGA
jgi:aminoglycoside phosphotransferase (APT) family kinase protein